MEHFIEIYTSEGFAWGILAGLAISLLIDCSIVWGKTKNEKN